MKFAKAHRNKMIKKEMTEIGKKNPFPVVILNHSLKLCESTRS